ncbi:hypothetical protein [Altererythrobacter sp. Root672]|uniref:hypothetical protein n=1 Tax=Altererythrobacter sp. Root672 TaxID=1736584 RepID=UPI0006F2D612|nr:hypothetical protein [Altererythrobacter sp. Root672]KRA83144.1 hypothetical protein ASD76_03475 [Altererythrobacter sp. Root672]
MQDKPKTTLPAFTPVPRQKVRHNGWSPEVQRAFIEALAETGSVISACRRVGRADHGAYLLRRHPEAEEFRQAWQAALDIGVQKIEDVAMDRAINGVEEPVYSYGKLVGTRIKFNDGLLMFMLRNRSPARFTGGRARALNAADKTTLNRLKKEWREEWERERFVLDQEEEQETFESIDRFLDDMRQNRRANMSPRARAAYDEAARIDKEDGTGWMVEDEDWEEDEGVSGGGAVALLPAGSGDEGEEPEAGPRVRTLKDEGW